MDNPLRLNFFSTAMRILFEHMMGTLAPVDQVVQTEWFVSEREGNVPTRGQRIVFAIQGGGATKSALDELVWWAHRRWQRGLGDRAGSIRSDWAGCLRRTAAAFGHSGVPKCSGYWTANKS